MSLGWVKKEERSGVRWEETRFLYPAERRRARARALPDAADAKPRGGANTTPEITLIELNAFFTRIY